MTSPEHLAAVFVAMAAVPARLAAMEAATAFKVSIPTMRRWVKRGEVPTVKIGNTVRGDMSRLHGTDREDIAEKVAKLRTP